MTTTPREKNYVVVEKRVRPARFTWSLDQLVLDVDKAADQPRTLFVKRRLLNAGAVRAWAAQQSIESALPAGDMHATVAFSKELVDWSTIAPDKGSLTIEDGLRDVHQFPARATPNGALVLRFSSGELHRRWQELRAAGASWGFPEYQPHVTITYSVPETDAAKIEPYRGPLIFGPEEFAEVSDDWAAEVVEEPLIKHSVPRRSLARRMSR